MPVRKATLADLEAVAKLLAAAFHDEELNAYFFPYRDQYPDDYVQAWYQIVLEKWWDYDSVWIVSYTTAKHSSTTEKNDTQLTGVAQWSIARAQNVKNPILYGSWDPRGYVTSTVALYTSAQRYIFPNRAIGRPSPDDPQPLRKWEFGQAIWPFCQHYYTEPSHRQTRWSLDLLGVDPPQQKRGFGSQLIAWGLQQAREHHVPAVVIMGKGLEGFYSRQGFEILVGYASTDDMTVEEKDNNGKLTRKTIANPLKQRGIGGGGIAWTRTEADK